MVLWIVAAVGEELLNKSIIIIANAQDVYEPPYEPAQRSECYREEE